MLKMHIKILRDSKGKILGSVRQIPIPMIHVNPVPSEGDTIESDVEVPENYEFDLEAFYKKFEKT